MKVHYQKNFLKDLALIPAQDRSRIENFVFEEVPNASTIQSLTKAEKLQGFKNYYKVRFGHYRIGIHIEHNVVTFERVLHRREIYRYFP